MKHAYFYTNYNNIAVLKTYLDVIKISLINLGYECIYVKSLSGVDKKDLIVHVLSLDAVKYYFQGYTNYILWQQGVNADESYMRNHNKLRYWLLNKIDIFAMKRARFILFVSEYMKKHYEKIGHSSFSEKSYIMPCFNEELDKVYFNSKKYKDKIFCYVGSLSPWQCFRETVQIYKNIEDRVPNAKLKVLTFSVEEGERIIKESGIKNYEIKCVPKEQVKAELQEATYGFIIREDNMVNRVATPTKISSYMSVGVIPIFSSCLIDFDAYSKSKGMKYVLGLPQDFKMEKIIDFIHQDINNNEIQSEYESIFSSYYSIRNHTINISERLRELSF